MSLLRSRWRELAVAALAFVILCIASGSMLLKQSGGPHFIYLADAWLHGRLDVVHPPNMNDWVRWNDKWYVYAPPFPAVLMLPFVALNGVAFNDTFFTVCIAGLNIGLFLAVLRAWRDHEGVDRPDRQLALLSLFFAFGTVYFFSSIRGEVWYTAHVVGVTLTLIYMWACLDAKYPLIAGLALGCAAITRSNMAFAFPFFLFQLFDKGSWRLQPRPAMIKLLKFGIPAAGVLFVAMLMNHLRWPERPGGGWTDFGHAMLYRNRVTERVNQFGLFNWIYLKDNFPSAFLLLPNVTPSGDLGFNDGHGLSIFVTTPLLMTIPFTLTRTRTMLALCVTVLIVALPGLFFMNDGWYQFGYRFSINYLPYLFLILALGKAPISGFQALLGFAGVAVNTWGASVFSRGG